MKASLTRLPLQVAFNSTFHNKFDFDDFLTLDVKSECQSFYINNKVIFNPSIKLKRYLRFLNSFVFDYAQINTDVVHSYRKGKNAYTAVVKHVDSKYFFQTDIKRFFNSITTQDIELVFENNLIDIPIVDIASI